MHEAAKVLSLAHGAHSQPTVPIVWSPGSILLTPGLPLQHMDLLHADLAGARDVNLGSGSRTYTRRLRACVVTLLGCNAPGAATVPAVVADVSRTFNPPAQTVNLRTPGKPRSCATRIWKSFMRKARRWPKEKCCRAQLRRRPPRRHNRPTQ